MTGPDLLAKLEAVHQALTIGTVHEDCLESGTAELDKVLSELRRTRGITAADFPPDSLTAGAFSNLMRQVAEADSARDKALSQRDALDVELSQMTSARDGLRAEAGRLEEQIERLTGEVAKLSEIAANALHGESLRALQVADVQAAAKKQREELHAALRAMLARVDYESGDFVADCACTSSGNEEPPGSVDVICPACVARRILGLTKTDATALG